MSFLLEQMTWPEARYASMQAKMAVIPVGSTEQHGPHLALLNDAATAEYFAWEVAKRLSPYVLVAPTVPFGVSEHHMRFAGTLALKPETLAQVLYDLASSLARHGFEKMAFFNGHGGNEKVLEELAARVKKELRVDMLVVNTWKLYPEMETDVLESKVWGHACEYETSITLYIHPENVRRERIGPAGEEMGVHGHPELASEEKGRKLVKATVERAVKAVEEFMLK